METDKPKMPHYIKIVYQQILDHDEYKTKIDEKTKHTFEKVCLDHSTNWMYNYKNKNYAYARAIWKHLYWGDPFDSSKFYFGDPMKCDRD